MLSVKKITHVLSLQTETKIAIGYVSAIAELDRLIYCALHYVRCITYHVILATDLCSSIFALDVMQMLGIRWNYVVCKQLINSFEI